MKRCALPLLLIALASCTKHRLSIPSAVANNDKGEFSYLDLEPGWRLRAIVPLTKSGTFLPMTRLDQAHEGTERPGTITLSAGSDFAGYETQFYAVEPRRRGVHVAFVAATATKSGKSEPRSEPAVDLFEYPGKDRYLRLVFLQRASRTDHNMAVIAGAQHAALEELTERVQENPEACLREREAVCWWIPAGIALRAEKPKSDQSGNVEWVPAR